MDWIRKFTQKAVEPLRGAPTVRRQKTYSAQSGHVYQYFYEGYRGIVAATEYVFDVSADRKTSIPVSVIVEISAVESWNVEHGRALTGTEQYAVAKLALFQAFDERDEPSQMSKEVRVRTHDLAAILESLDIN